MNCLLVSSSDSECVNGSAVPQRSTATSSSQSTIVPEPWLWLFLFSHITSFPFVRGCAHAEHPVLDWWLTFSAAFRCIPSNPGSTVVHLIEDAAGTVIPRCWVS